MYRIACQILFLVLVAFRMAVPKQPPIEDQVDVL